MKTVFRSIIMTFSMFSIIPMPMVKWERENRKYMLCALPLVGVFIGMILYLWQFICRWLGLVDILFAAGLTLIPLCISGGIHMDGFCDTVDALSSRASPERKREILKDSHTGAFAVIFCAAYFLGYFALAAEAGRTGTAAIFLGTCHAFARSLGALAGVAFAGSGKTGMLAASREDASEKAPMLLAVWCVLCATVLISLSPVSGIVCACAGVGLLWYLRVMAKREFGGMSGDLAGYLITLSELVLLACYIFTEKAVAVCF